MHGFKRLFDSADPEEQTRLLFVKSKLADAGFINDFTKHQQVIGQHPNVLNTMDMIWSELLTHPTRLIITNDIKTMGVMYSLFPILVALNNKGISVSRLSPSELIDKISELGESSVFKQLSRYKLIVLSDFCKAASNYKNWSSSIEYVISNLLFSRYLLMTCFTNASNESDAKKEVIVKIRLSFSPDLAGIIRQTFKPIFLFSDPIDYF